MAGQPRNGAREGLGERIQGAAVVAAETPTLVTSIERQRSEVERALPVHLKINAEQYVRAAITLVKQTPGLADCDPRTVLGGLMTAAQLGLEFGPLGHAYLVPFKNRRTGRKEAQFILGYKGELDLCWRSGKLESISAREVCEGDEFDFDYGLADSLHHKPNLSVPRTKETAYAYYGVAKFVGGGHYFVVLGENEIESHRQRSLAKDNGPWVSDYMAMARKTVIHVMRPFLPLSSEIARELAKDESVIRGETIDTLEAPEYIEVEVGLDDAPEDEIADGEVVDTDTGEIFDANDPEDDAPRGMLDLEGD